MRTFKGQLDNILNDLSKHKRNRNELLPYYINMRLNKSLKRYYTDISSSYTYLDSKDEIKVMKALGK